MRLLTPTSVELTYDEGETLPAVEFRFRPVRDITGRIFSESKDKNGVFDGTDKPKKNIPVRLWEYGEDEDPRMETKTDTDGYFVFEDVPQGLYLVTVGDYDEDKPKSAIRLVFPPGDPAPILFSMPHGDD